MVPAFFAVTSTAPAADDADASTTAKVVAVFNKALDAATVDDASFTLKGGDEAAVTGTVTVNAATNTATFSHSGLTTGVTYTATITTAVKDQSGQALVENVTWTFVTGGADTTAPTVSSTNPAHEATGVLRNSRITVTFDEAIDPETVNTSNFLLTNFDKQPVTGTLSYLNPKTVVFKPNNNLAATNEHTFTVTTGVADISGNGLLANHVITFTTGDTASTSPAAVDLGTAGDYVILAKAGISTTGVTSITGDIAVSPADLTAITGFSLTKAGTFATSDLVIGKVFAADLEPSTPTILTTAVEDMLLAYSDAAGRTDNAITELGAGDISGMTLEPGLYQWGTGLLVASDVTLSGDAGEVWIFQIAGDLKLNDGVAVLLDGGALPENVFWQVAGSATLQAGVAFNGIILGETDVAMKSGATVNGRVLAQTAVTLIGNTIVQPE